MLLQLTHQFGDVPYLNKEITEPKLDFYTYDRWSIFGTVQKDMNMSPVGTGSSTARTCQQRRLRCLVDEVLHGHRRF